MPPSGLTFAQCEQYFHLPVAKAALQLGVSRPTISKVLRRHGVKRWPFRKLQAQARHQSALPGPHRTRVPTSSRPAAGRHLRSPNSASAALRASVSQLDGARRRARRATSRASSRSKHAVCTSPTPSLTLSVKHAAIRSYAQPRSSSPPAVSSHIVHTPPFSPSTHHSRRAAEASVHTPSQSAMLPSPPTSCASSPPQTPPHTPPQVPPYVPPYTPPHTPHYYGAERNDPFAPWAPWAPCELWGPPRSSRPCTSRAVFGGAWTRGVFTDSDQGVHFQFLAPGERVCTPKLSQNATATDDVFEQQFVADRDEDFVIRFGDVYEGLLGSDVLGLQ